MEIKLAAIYVLTDEHGKSPSNMSILMNMRTNESYNPTDRLEAYPSWGKMQARDVVKRLVNRKAFNDDEKYFIERFTGKLFQW